jgi:uncharacterized SAM-binding protein YcdF (DUF218 family)
VLLLRLFRALGGVLLFALGAWALLIAAVYLYGERDEARPADAIVVLGAAQYDGRPSPVLRARLDHAIELYREGYAPLVILTGGVGAGDTVSEAVVGSRYAEKHGIPAEAILTERAGLSTRESIDAVALMMHRRELESAILVSDPFHMLRLRILARSRGIDALSSPTRTSPISRDPSLEWRHVLRESAGIPLLLAADED